MLDHDLVARIADSTGLSDAESRRVIGDVLSHYAEPLEDYVRRRHAALRLRGIRNEEVYRIVGDELRHRVVAAPTLSERQLRRIIYG